MFNKLIILEQLHEENKYLKNAISNSINEENKQILINRLTLVEKEIKRLEKTL